MAELTHAEKPAALKDWAYAVIKQAILNLEIGPGEQLHVDDVAQQMGTSRTPIREALVSLEKDGLVTAVPRVGYFVTPITIRDLEELFELRALLESYATKQAVSKLTPADIEQVEQLLQESCRAVDDGRFEDFLPPEIALHEMLIQRSGNRRLAELMQTLSDLTYRERRLSLKDQHGLRHSCDEHRRLVQAICRGDAEEAGAAMWDHMWGARQRMVELAVALGEKREPEEVT
jgi:DNA-binding GntR family transcriptional regulator